MPKYIDAEALKKKLFPFAADKSSYSINAKSVYKTIEKMPSSAVVGKSEVAFEIMEHLEGKGLLTMDVCWAIAELIEEYDRER